MLRSCTNKRTRLIRRVSLLLSFILLVQIFPIANNLSYAASDGMIRVRLTRVGTPSSVSFRTTGSFNVAGQTVASGTTVTVALSAGKLTMTAGTKTLASGSSITFNRNSTGSGCGVRFTSPSLANLYCGDLIFSVNGSGIQTVLRIYIETYLYGVVPYEMSNSYPLEALKAQAIAARTFALRAKGSSGSYDVNDNANSQVFRGYSAAYSNAINAVDATRGICLMSGGSYAQCVYTASNGGQTESSKNAWGGAISYLIVKDDPYDLENPESPVKKAMLRRDGTGLPEEFLALLREAVFAQPEMADYVRDPEFFRVDDPRVPALPLDDLYSLIPLNDKRAYDMYNVIGRLFDNSEFKEYKKAQKKEKKAEKKEKKAEKKAK